MVAALALGLSIALHARAAPPGVPPSYAVGYFRWSTARSTADVQRSVPYFEQAIRDEPRSALGYAGLADARLSLALRELDSPHSVVDIRAAFTAAKQGVALDPSSPEAHAAFGQAHALFGDSRIAERELQRAVELQPDSVESRTWYGELLMSQARIDDAMTQFRAALAQNSSWTEAADNLAFLSYLRRAYAQSAAYANQSLAQNPGDTMAPMVLALANGQLHRRPEAERALRSLTHKPANALSAHALLSYYYARDHDPGAAVSELSLTRQLSQRIGVVRDPSAIVSIAASLAAQRQTDAAYAWLSRVDRESRKLFASDARLDDIRTDQRFRAWLKAV
jgi:tetratricopeptide (TPR) repeat protein